MHNTLLGCIMKNSISWVGGTNIEGKNEAGLLSNIGWKVSAPTPMELVLQSAGACSLIDVVVGLKEREIRCADVELIAERAESSPRIFTKIHMHYIVDADAPDGLVERIIAKSQEKYCSVSLMLKGKVDITWSLN